MKPIRHVPTYAWLIAAVPVVALIWVIGNLLQHVLIPWYFRIILLSGIAIISAVSLNIVNGFTGQFSIGHAGFMLVGAYASSTVTVFGSDRVMAAMQSAHVPTAAQEPLMFALAIVVGAVAAAIMGLLVGLPSLRLRGDYLAIATLGFGEAIRGVFVTVDAVGGASGLHNMPKYTSFVWVFSCAVGVVLMARGLAMSRHGRDLFAIREDELAAQAVGVNAFRYKVLAFVIASAWAGVAGVMISHLNSGIVPQDYGFMASFAIVVMIVVGGLGSITGAVVAAVLLSWPTELMRLYDPIAPYRLVIYPALLVLMMLIRPQGLFGRKEFGLELLRGTGSEPPAAKEEA